MAAKKPAEHAKLENKSNSIKSSHGGKREGAGRPLGSQNKTTKELGAAAREHTSECLEILVTIAREGQSEACRLQAIGQILDRGHGKAKQHVDLGSEGGTALALTLADARERLAAKLDRIQGNGINAQTTHKPH